MYDNIEPLFALSFIFFGSIIYFIVAIFYLLSLAKAAKCQRQLKTDPLLLKTPNEKWTTFP